MPFWQPSLASITMQSNLVSNNFSNQVDNRSSKCRSYSLVVLRVRECEGVHIPRKSLAQPAGRSAVVPGRRGADDVEGQSLGLALHEHPIISRVVSIDHPTEIMEGMIFALETCPATDDFSAARIEEEVVVTRAAA